MAKLRLLALAGIVSCGWANAADLPPAPSLPEQAATDEFSGWYLRGDVGGGVNSARPELETAPSVTAASADEWLLSGAAVRRLDNATLSPFGMVDVGAGYQFDSWFRADATLEYRAGARLDSLYSQPQVTDSYRADVSSFVGLVNGYATPGTWYGFTPFLGAGVGVAENRVSGFAGSSGGHFANGSRTSFAWALMAGVDYDISPSLKLELGYRYLNYGAIAAVGSDCVAGGSGGAMSGCVVVVVASTISSRNRLASNDFRLGLIYWIGAAPPSVVTQ
jgi:opacity protein-like surface antigen